MPRLLLPRGQGGLHFLLEAAKHVREALEGRDGEP